MVWWAVPLFASSSAELLSREVGSQKARESSQTHTCPDVEGRLPLGNLNLSVAQEFCSLRL